MTPAFVRAATALRLVDLWITPFYSVSPDAVPAKRVLKRRFAPWLETGLPLMVQLIGHAPAELAACAARLEEIGVRAVNLNLACPSRTVVGHGSGGALLKDPGAVGKIVSGIRNAVSAQVSVSVKIRAGYDSDAMLPELIGAAEDAELIIFHYRTVTEQYRPVSDGLKRLEQAVECANVPVIGNGDIGSAEDAETMVRETGCAGIALARSFLKNPGILNALRTGEAVNAGARCHAMLEEMERFESGPGPLLEFARAGLPEEEFRVFLEQCGAVKR